KPPLPSCLLSKRGAQVIGRVCFRHQSSRINRADDTTARQDCGRLWKSPRLGGHCSAKGPLSKKGGPGGRPFNLISTTNYRLTDGPGSAAALLAVLSSPDAGAGAEEL